MYPMITRLIAPFAGGPITLILSSALETHPIKGFMCRISSPSGIGAIADGYIH